jgi:hypothetical protein
MRIPWRRRSSSVGDRKKNPLADPWNGRERERENPGGKKEERVVLLPRGWVARTAVAKRERKQVCEVVYSKEFGFKLKFEAYSSIKTKNSNTVEERS